MRFTRSANHVNSSGRMWGNDVAFVSTVDLAFNGNNTQQIFVYNHFQWVCQNGSPVAATEARCPNPPIPFLQQVTFGAGNPDNPSVSQAKGTCQLDPNVPCEVDQDCTDVNAGQCYKDNQWVAFDALGSFNGGTGPQAQHRQIFLFNRDTNELFRVTQAVDGDSTHPSLNIQGGLMVFQSTAALTGVPNPGGVEQIFVFEKKTGLIKQITFGEAPSLNPTINQGGSMIAFQSKADLLRSGADTGHYQIFWAEYDKVNHTAFVRRLTNGDGDSINPNLGPTSRALVFESVATNLAGTPGGSQIYRSSRLDITPITVEQVTFQSAFGDCHYPNLSPGGDRIVFICDGDPLANGTDGPRAFTIDLDDAVLRQLTGAGQVQGPITHSLGRWFVALSTTSTLTHEEACGFQMFALDYYDAPPNAGEPLHWVAAKAPGELPPDVVSTEDPGGIGSNVIGKVNFLLQREGAGAPGSHVDAIQQDSTIAAPLIGQGMLPMVIGAPDLVTHLNPVRLAKDKVTLPPIPLPNVGYLCLTPTSDGLGSLDCEGDNMGGTVHISLDHNVPETQDPQCNFGCREGTTCQKDWIQGPHKVLCTADCVDNVCDSGFNQGAACTDKIQCRPAACQNGSAGMCNGPVTSDLEGSSRAGDMHLNLPVHMTLYSGAGIDGVQCTSDDVLVAKGIDTILRLTTGGQSTAIFDRDASADVSLLAERSGLPFDCDSLRARIVLGSQMIGVLPLLDIPAPVGATRDTILQLVLEPRIEPNVCDVPCQNPSDCDDGNLCNGIEQCINSVCKPGTPHICDDGNPCNGLETCDPNTNECLPGTPCNDGDPCNGVESCSAQTGCVPGTPHVCSNNDACDGLEVCDPTTNQCLPAEAPDCDDSNPCTADACDKIAGCVHQPIDGDCDDGSNCTTGDACVDGECRGTSICDDGDACNGKEGCIEETLECVPAEDLDCDDFNSCTADSCDHDTGCVHTPIPGSCDDSNACTQGDTCLGGDCVGTPKQCGDGNACNGLEECDPSTGNCVPGAPTVCDNGDSCPDSCDQATGCIIAPCNSTTIQPLNRAPVCDGAAINPDDLFPPNHKMVPAQINGVVDPDGDSIAIEITGIQQDEPLDQGKRALACADADGMHSSTAWLRAERRSKGDGRVYHVQFIARDGRGGSCTGDVSACVPHDKSGKGSCGDQGPLVDSTQALCDGTCSLTCGVEVRVARLPSSCEDQAFPKYVQSRIGQSQALVAKGSGLVGRGRSKQMISAGVRMLQKTARAVFKAEREGGITPDCSTLLTDKLQDAINAAQAALAGLKTPK